MPVTPTSYPFSRASTLSYRVDQFSHEPFVDQPGVEIRAKGDGETSLTLQGVTLPLSWLEQQLLGRQRDLLPFQAHGDALTCSGTGADLRRSFGECRPEAGDEPAVPGPDDLE